MYLKYRFLPLTFISNLRGTSRIWNRGHGNLNYKFDVWFVESVWPQFQESKSPCQMCLFSFSAAHSVNSQLASVALSLSRKSWTLIVSEWESEFYPLSISRCSPRPNVVSSATDTRGHGTRTYRAGLKCEFHYGCCLPLLPGNAYSIHATWRPPFSRALCCRQWSKPEKNLVKCKAAKAHHRPSLSRKGWAGIFSKINWTPASIKGRRPPSSTFPNSRHFHPSLRRNGRINRQRGERRAGKEAYLLPPAGCNGILGEATTIFVWHFVYHYEVLKLQQCQLLMSGNKTLLMRQKGFWKHITFSVWRKEH